MSEAETIQTVLNALNERRCAEFRINGESYLIQPDNNKGCDYLSLWRTSPRPERLGEAMFDILFGIDADAVSELVRLCCIRGHSVLDWAQSGGLEWL